MHDLQPNAFELRTFRDGSITAVKACSCRSFARHSHNEFGIGLITQGAQRSWSGRGAVEAVAGNLITVNPAELHDGKPIGAARSWSMLYVSPELIAGLFADLEGRIPTQELHAPVIADPRLSHLFAASWNAMSRDGGGIAHEEHLLELFGRLFDIRPSSSPGYPSSLTHVKKRIDDDPAQAHTLAELAALAGLSRFQTIRLFARLTGLTPHAYVMQRRIDAARQFIRDGSALAEAAAGAGFADQSHMHRTFVARHGFTPGAYAEAHRRRGAISSKNIGARLR